MGQRINAVRPYIRQGIKRDKKASIMACDCRCDWFRPHLEGVLLHRAERQYPSAVMLPPLPKQRQPAQQ